MRDIVQAQSAPSKHGKNAKIGGKDAIAFSIKLIFNGGSVKTFDASDLDHEAMADIAEQAISEKLCKKGITL
jgi:hypothetical protein